MQRFHAILVGFLVLFAAPSAWSQAADENRVALVIGNSTYEVSPLKNPENDARLMAEALRGQGFEVVEVINGTRRDMRLAMIEFGDLLLGGGVGLFYYAGHGVQVGGENYLVPVNAVIDREEHVEIESINVNQVLGRMGGARNRLNIVILDSCRNNPYARSFRSAPAGLAQMLAPTGTYIGYATAPGEVAVDGTGENSPFTQALVNRIGEPGLPLEGLFKQVRLDVQEATGGKQVPWTSSSLTGEFFFTPPAPVATTPAPEPEKPAADDAAATLRAETAFWTSVAESDDPADFEAYLEQYPEGNFAALARRRIDRLNTPEPDQDDKKGAAEALRAETAFWTSIAQGDNLADFEAYLAQYPDGAFAALANARIETLRNPPPARQQLARAPAATTEQPAVPARTLESWNGVYPCQRVQVDSTRYCENTRGEVTIENGILVAELEVKTREPTYYVRLKARVDAAGNISESTQGHVGSLGFLRLTGTLWDAHLGFFPLRFADPPAVTASPARSAGSESAAEREAAALRAETAFWTSIAQSDNVADFEAYLAQYPDGAFAALAKARLEALRNPPQQVARAPQATTEQPARTLESWDGRYRCSSVRTPNGERCRNMKVRITIKNGAFKGNIEHRARTTGFYQIAGKIDAAGKIIESEPVRGGSNNEPVLTGKMLTGTLWDMSVGGLVTFRFVDPPPGAE